MALNETTTGVRLLDWVYERICDPETLWEAMDSLFDGLYALRQASTPEDWKHFISTACASHALRALLQEDPITFRSCAKPRGYAGDAVLLDLLYANQSVRDVVAESSEIGQQLYSYIIDTPAARGVRSRRKLIAETIDETADRIDAPEILSIACGHLREADASTAMRNWGFQRFVGLDHDPETISYDATHLGPLGIELVHGNALHLLKGTMNLGQFDLIYASGLFDYLNQSLAQKLACVMFDMLKPGGRMLIINAVPTMRDSGFMEAFMDWNLIYRDLDELVDVAAKLPREAVANQDVYLEENQNFAFLQITKR